MNVKVSKINKKKEGLKLGDQNFWERGMGERINNRKYKDINKANKLISERTLDN